MPRERPHIHRESGKFPFHSDQQNIVLGVEMLVDADDMAVRAVNEVSDGGRDALLVGTTGEENSGVSHAAPARPAYRSARLSLSSRAPQTISLRSVRAPRGTAHTSFVSRLRFVSAPDLQSGEGGLQATRKKPLNKSNGL